MQNFRFKTKSIPLFFATLIILTYGLLISQVGYHWDDWVFLFLAKFYSPSELIRAFATCRPFLGPSFYLTTMVLGDRPILWQAFGLLIRFVMTYAFWWSLSQVWPKHKRQVLMTTLLFLVFPGYGQQWVALTHINQELIPLIAYIFSFGFTAYALRNPAKKTRATVLALVLMFVGQFSTEYFIGLEFMRLLILGYMSQGLNITNRIRYAIKRWAPYILMWAANGLWLFYYYTSGLYQSYGVRFYEKFNNTSLQNILEIILEPLKTLRTVGISSWVQTTGIFQLSPQSMSFWFALGLFILAFLLVCLFLLKMDHEEMEEHSDTWAYQAIALGITGILAGRIPTFVAGLPVSTRFEFDRFQIAMMFGACLLLMGVIELLLRAGNRKVYILSLIIALAVGWQFVNADAYRRDWTQQKQFFTQLTWRMPAIKPDTILLTHQIDTIPFESDMALTGPLNWIYAPSLSSYRLPYTFMFTKIRLGTKLPSLEPNQEVAFDYRTAYFKGNTTDSILFYQPDAGCLKVIDSNHPDESMMAQLPLDLREAVQLSNLSRIDSHGTPAAVPERIFGKELEKSWCYYYQKAELARQLQDWAQIAALGQEASSKGYSPQDPVEWIPFIEGFIYTGSFEQANRILDDITKKHPQSRPSVCAFLKRMQSQSPNASQQGFTSANIDKHECHD